MNNFPFTQSEVLGTLIREFSKNVDSGELVWHRDRQDRKVLVKKGEGWKLQMENSLPVDLRPGMVYEIPKNTYHRVMKGTSDLIVEIEEYDR